MNKDKIILDLCGGTGSWSRPYKDAGYTVHIISLPEFNVGDWWIVNNEIKFRKQVWKKDGGEFLSIPISNLYGILAAPPCTHFSLARTRAKIPRDLAGGMTTVESCLSLIQAVQKDGHKLVFWAIENPRGYLRRFLGKPPFSFYHWQFDEAAAWDKPTDVWGSFNDPRPIVTKRPIENSRHPKNWQSPKVPEGYEAFKLDRAAIRAITPHGFAEAFMKVNK